MFTFFAHKVFAHKLTGTCMHQPADMSTFFCTFFRYMCHKIASILENEDASAAIFIEPNDSCTSNEEYADKDDEGLIDNLSRSLLNAPVEAWVSNGRRMKICQINTSNEAIDAEQI